MEFKIERKYSTYTVYKKIKILWIFSKWKRIGEAFTSRRQAKKWIKKHFGYLNRIYGESLNDLV